MTVTAPSPRPQWEGHSPHVRYAATMSPCGTYRYDLEREFEPKGPWVMFIGLNPSTADAEKDDFEGYAKNRDHLRKEVVALRDNVERLQASVKLLKGAERRLLKDWRVISGAIADHVVAFVPKEHKYARVASSIAHYIRRWRPEEVMPSLAASSGSLGEERT